MSEQCQGVLHFNMMKLEGLVPMYLFAIFIKFFAPILSGKFEFVPGNCQGSLVSPKCVNPELVKCPYIWY